MKGTRNLEDEKVADCANELELLCLSSERRSEIILRVGDMSNALRREIIQRMRSAAANSITLDETSVRNR